MFNDFVGFDADSLTHCLSAACMLLTGLAAVISSNSSDDEHERPRRYARRASGLQRTDADSWRDIATRTANAVLGRMGSAVISTHDGERYVIADSVRQKIAALLRRHRSKNLPGQLYLSLAEWLTIPPNPVQRNEKKRYNKCAEKFSKVTKSQLTVYIAVQEDGVIEILDGHTRTHGWRHGLIADAELPDELNVIIHFVKDRDETISEYYTFDDQTQTKNGNEQLFSACEFNNFFPTEGGFVYNGCGLVDALRTAFEILAACKQINKSMLRRATETPNLKKKCKPTLIECVKRFKLALRALDSLNPPSSKFKGAVSQAFLLAHTKYVGIGFGDPSDEAKLMEFFTKYRDGLTNRKDGKFDAVENFREIHNEPGGGAGDRKEKLPRLLGAIERYVENGPNKMYAQDGIVNMSEYFKSRTALSKGNGARQKKKGR